MTTQAPTSEYLQYLLVKDHIDKASKEDQEKILSLAGQVRAILREHAGHGHLAFALVGAEMANGMV